MPRPSRRTEQVAEAIAAGEVAETVATLQPGSAPVWLPSWADMAARHGASKSTVRDALTLLAERGLIEVVPRTGARVLAPRRVQRSPQHQGRLRQRMRGFGLAADEAGYTAWVDVISVRDVPAPSDAGRYLRVPAGTPVLERARVHGVIEGGRPPVMLSWTWYAPQVAEALPILRGADTGVGGTTSRLIDAGWDPRWEEILLARNASPDEAAALHVAPGAALIEVWRPCTDAGTGQVLEVTLRLINPARHELVYP